MSEVWSKIRFLFGGRRRVADDLKAEIDAHLQFEVEDRLAAGMTVRVAEQEARRALGNETLIRDRALDVWSIQPLESLLGDLRYAIRTGRRTPVFTLFAVLSLAVGIGANVTVFSIMNAVLTMRFPYREPQRLVVVETTDAGGMPHGVAPAAFSDWKTQAVSLERMAAKIDWTAYNLTGPEGAEQVIGVPVSEGMFEVLGLRAVAGRTFTSADDRLGAEPVAILGDQLWRRRYNGNTGVLGRQIQVSGVSRTIIGIMGPGVYLNRDENTASGHVDEMWVPLRSQLSADIQSRYDLSNLRVFGRLQPGVSLEHAQAEMQLIDANVRRSHPEDASQRGVRVEPLSSFRSDRIQTPRQITLILFAAVGLVLLIACINVAGLQLGRAGTRRREIAIRAALGAGRSRIIRQLLTESILLGIAGGALGLAVATGAMSLIKAFVPPNLPLPRLEQLTIDYRVLAYAVFISILTGIATGLAPAVFSSVGIANRGTENTLDTSGGRVAGDRWGSRLRQILVAGELAVTVLLLVGAGLLLRTLMSLRGTEPGYQPGHVLTVALPAPDVPSSVLVSQDYNQRRNRLTTSILNAVGQLPLVLSAGIVNGLPATGGLYTSHFLAEGRNLPGLAIGRVVSADYFKTMGIPLRAGRVFGPTDTSTAVSVAVVDTAVAQQYFADENALGKRLRWQAASETTPWVTIIGVVATVRDNGPDSAPQPEIYLPYLQAGSQSLRNALVVRTEADPAALSRAVRQVIHDIDPEQPVGGVRTMSDVLFDSLAAERFNAYVLTVFAAIALALAAAGVYGVVSYSVTRRTKEIGVRMALGATPGRVLGTILKKEVTAMLIGLFTGGLSAASAAKTLESFLYGIVPTDPLTITGVMFILAVVIALASYLPARRVMKLDPMLTLRTE